MGVDEARLSGDGLIDARVGMTHTGDVVVGVEEPVAIGVVHPHAGGVVDQERLVVGEWLDGRAESVPSAPDQLAA